MTKCEETKLSLYSAAMDDAIAEYSRQILFNINCIAGERKISYDALSRITGISAGYLYCVLIGKRTNVSLKILLKLIVLLGLSPRDYLPPQLLKDSAPPNAGCRFTPQAEYTKRKKKNREISGQMTLYDFMEDRDEMQGL